MISLDSPLDLRSPDAGPFLAGIQGNILKSHGRDHAAHLLIRFGRDSAGARKWVASFARERLTTAAAQIEQTAAWKRRRDRGQPFAGMLLSAAGYAALGVPGQLIPREEGGTYFERGMKRQADTTNERRFNDPPAEQWQREFQSEIHALVLLADDEPQRLDRLVAEISAELAPHAEALWVERGDRLEFDFEGRGRLTIEHFGYQDGVSNPLFIVEDIEDDRARRGSNRWDPAASLSLVLAREPGEAERFGSFFVFRKLEQNVRGFRAALDQLAQLLGLSGADAERAGAMAVGRFRDGIPIIPTTVVAPGADPNDFNYYEDTAGQVCPFHSHIRKTNPRGDTARLQPDTLPEEERRRRAEEFERSMRIARRGITYGARPDLAPGSDLPHPEAGVGLLFMSFQARLEQFAIQQEGSDSNDFVEPAVGVDAVIGQNAEPIAQRWLSATGPAFTMANFVRLLGGEYFFAPSVAFLRELEVNKNDVLDLNE